MTAVLAAQRHGRLGLLAQSDSQESRKPNRRTVNQTSWNWNQVELVAQMELVELEPDGTEPVELVSQT